MNIELRHLRYFVAVAEESGFTAAARRAHVTQQVLSAQIRQLEDAVGTALLARTSRGVVLTAAGSAFLDSARETLASLERGMAAALHASRVVVGRLTVGLSAATGGLARSRVLAAFSAAYPSVDVDLAVYDLAHPAAGLLDHGTDVALLRPPVSAAGLAMELVESEERVFVLAADHPLASRSFLELSEVAGLPWVAAALSVDGCAPAAFRDDWLAAPRPGGGIPVAGPVIGAVARTIEEWREYVVAGRGIGLCPESAEAFSARPGTVFVPARGVPPTSLCVAWRADDRRPAVLGFVTVATSGSLPDIGLHPGGWSGWTPVFIADGDTGSRCSPCAYGGRFMTVSAAAMMKAGLPSTAAAGASRARRQDWATSRWSM
jgi:DNA-binding transcriptional LysR family regulator